jgi:hypothetical protein
MEIVPHRSNHTNSNAEEDSDVWNGFYKKPLQTRLDQLKLLYPDLAMKPLPSDIADSMIENCVGIYFIILRSN